MSIRTMQILKIKDKIINDELKAGIIPTSKTIQDKLELFFSKKSLGNPYYIQYSPEKYDISNPVMYNESFSALGEDLSISFEEVKKLNSDIMSIFEYYENQKVQVEADIERLSLTLESMTELTSGNIVVENFMNFYNIEFSGDSQSNIPHSTAFIDLEERSVYLPRILNKDRKISLSNGKIKVDTKALNISEEIGKRDAIINDAGNDTLFLYGSHKDNSEQSITIDIELKKAVKINMLSITTKSLATVAIKPEISEDGISYNPIYTVKTKGPASWVFVPTNVLKIRFTLTKLEAEGYSNDLYFYYFIIDNISAFCDLYHTKAALISKAITANKVLNNVTLKAEDIVYSETDIQYYIGIDDGTPIDWKRVTLNKSHYMGLLTSNRSIIDSEVPVYGAKSGALYKITDIPINTDISTIELISGYQMWSIKHITLNESITKLEPRHAYTDREVFIEYIPCEIYTIGCPQNKIVHLSQFVKCQSPMTVSERKISGAQDTMIFLNNVLVPPSDGVYTLRMLEGVNKIDIYILGDDNVKHNINMKTVSFDIYAEKPMKLKTLYELKTISEHNTFGCKNGFIYITYNPKNKYDTKFLIRYNYLDDEKPNVNTKFRVMTVLSTENPYITPKLLNQQIIME